MSPGSVAPGGRFSPKIAGSIFQVSAEENARIFEKMLEDLGMTREDWSAAMKEEKKVWCSCGNPSGNVEYHADGEGEYYEKHHWTCADCSLVVQVG
jgi:hypothetical protein